MEGMVSSRQNIGRDQTLEEKYSNVVEQLSGATSRLERTERDLDLERATREDIIRSEVARRLSEAERRIRAEVSAEFSSERESMDKERRMLDRRAEDMQKSFGLMAQRVQAEAEHRIREAQRRAEEVALAKMAAQFDHFMRLIRSVIDGRPQDVAPLLEQYAAACDEAHAALEKDVKKTATAAIGTIKPGEKTGPAVKTVKLLAQSTGDFTRDELRKDTKLTWTDKAKAEINAARENATGAGDSGSGSAGTGGAGSGQQPKNPGGDQGGGSDLDGE